MRKWLYENIYEGLNIGRIALTLGVPRSMVTNDWMIYGANGYTGRMIAREAMRRGWQPILAGRNPLEISALGKELGLPTRVFDCKEVGEIRRNTAGMRAVLHCAGPFSATSTPMLKACMEVKAHYLDITGEISVFEKILSRTAEVAAAKIVAIPGVGFDVVPSDCLAAMLKAELPDATDLELILKPSGSFSPGTMKTMIEGFYVGTVVRENGKIRILDHFESGERRFRESNRNVLGIAWGDIATAFYSTGIPNIRIFLVTPAKQVRFLRRVQKLRMLWKLPLMQRVLKKLVELRIPGPGESELSRTGYEIWGTVKNRDGASKSLGIRTPNGYSFTVQSALASLQELMMGNLKPGAYTPSMAFGKDFVLSLPDVHLFRE